MGIHLPYISMLLLLLNVVYLHSTAAELCISMTAAATVAAAAAVAVAECYISKFAADFIISKLAAVEFYIYLSMLLLNVRR